MKKVRVYVSSIVISLLILTLIRGTVFGQVKDTKPRTLKFATVVPEKSFQGTNQKWWANEIEKRTNGKIKIQMFWMESLVPWKDMYHGVSSGICDVGVPCSTYNPSDFPLYMVLDMPYNVRDYWVGNMAAIDTVENEPNLRAELEKAGIKFLANWNSGFFQLATRKPFEKISELKGKSFRTFGGARIKWMENLGINPIFMSYAEIYEAMDRGTIFGFDLVFQLSDAFKHYEVAKFIGLVDSGLVLTCATVMNTKVWNTLPKNIQDVFMKVKVDYASHLAEELYKLESNFMKDWQTKHGVVIKKLSPEEDKIARDAGKKAQEWFLEKQEAGGAPARKVWDYFQKSQKKYEDELKAKKYPWERK
jgi:TRAP-type C4-dicarboxylate transport system substrate-binding protein